MKEVDTDRLTKARSLSSEFSKQLVDPSEGITLAPGGGLSAVLHLLQGPFS